MTTTNDQELITKAGPETDVEIVAGAEIIPPEDALVELAEALGLSKAASGNFRATTLTREALAEILASPISKSDLAALSDFIGGMRALSPGSSTEVVATLTSTYQWEASMRGVSAGQQIGSSSSREFPVGPYTIKESEVGMMFMQTTTSVGAAAVMAQSIYKGMNKGGMYTGRVKQLRFDPTEAGSGKIRYRLHTTEYTDEEIAGRPEAWVAQKARLDAEAKAEKARLVAAGMAAAESAAA